LKIRTVWIKYDRDFPLPHLGAAAKINLACTLQADIEENDVFVDVISYLQEVARSAVKNEFDRLPKPEKKKSELAPGKGPSAVA
jgi:hypothetical protein